MHSVPSGIIHRAKEDSAVFVLVSPNLQQKTMT